MPNLKYPLRNKNKEIIFKDFPLFKPNLTPKEIFEMGSFGGTYFRPIYSSVNKKHYKNQHKEFQSLGWFKNIDIETYIISSKCQPKINKYKVKAGSSLKAWEDSGWIKEIDPYGWFQWYCRFYCGRRCDDDKRQVQRWINYAGKNSGRWRRRLIKMCKDKNALFDDYSISPVIRQGLQHWGYKLTQKDFNLQ